LLAVDDTGMSHSFGMQPEEVIVLRHHDTAARRGELKLCLVGRADQAGIGGSSHINVTPPQTSCNAG